MSRQNGKSNMQLESFIKGFITCKAMQAKEEGLFEDLTIEQVTELMTIVALENWEDA